MDLATLADLQQLKVEILEAINSLKSESNTHAFNWAKSKKTREILGCSPGTLQNLRLRGEIEFSKLGDSYYYSIESISKILEQNKQSSF